jgi:hypothetical protein
MTFALARSLLLADAVTPEALGRALLVAATRGTSLVRALLETRAIDPLRLEQQLESGDVPYMRHVAPVMVLVQHLPPGLCVRLLALPVRRDVRTGTIDVAVVDAGDPYPVEEMAHWLAAPVRMVRTSLASMDAALRHIHAGSDFGVQTLAAPIWVASPSRRPDDSVQTSAYRSPGLQETPLAVPPSEWGHAEATDFPSADPNIPFALTRKSVDPVRSKLTESRPRREALADLREAVACDPHALADLREAVPPFAEVTTILEAIRDASDRDSILELVVAGTRTVARKVAVLAVRRDALVGWTCSPELGERNAIRAARMSPGMSDVFTEALAGDAAHLARIPKDAAHAPLLSAMRSAPSAEVALIAVRVEGKAVALVLADELGDTSFATRRMEALAGAAGDALGRLLRERRKGGPHVRRGVLP